MLIKPENSDILSPIDKCLICESTNLKPLRKEQIRHAQAITDPDVADILRPYHDREFILNKCFRCGFLQPEGLPKDSKYFEAMYDQKWSEEWMLGDFENTYKDYIFLRILATLGRKLPNNRRKLLDVGAHVGKMISCALKQGWQADGLELNDQTRKIAIRMTGRPVHRMMAKEFAAMGMKYDAITLTDVLEHIPYPVEVLTDLYDLLTPGGIISVKVPFGINQLRKQQIRAFLGLVDKAEIGTSFVHVNHFSPVSLKSALLKAGYTNVKVEVGAPEFPPGGGLKGSLDRTKRRFVFALAQLPFAVHSPLALNLQAFAMKP